MSKQQTSISSFFKPKNSAKTSEAAQTKKPLGLSNKENEKDLVKKTKKILIDSEDDDDIRRKRSRNKGLESTEEEDNAPVVEKEEQKPPKKKLKKDKETEKKKKKKSKIRNEMKGFVVSDSESEDELHRPNFNRRAIDDSDSEDEDDGEYEGSVHSSSDNLEYDSNDDDDLGDEAAWLQKDLFNDEKRIHVKKSKKELRDEKSSKNSRKVTGPNSGSSDEGSNLPQREYGDTEPFSASPVEDNNDKPGPSSLGKDKSSETMGIPKMASDFFSKKQNSTKKEVKKEPKASPKKAKKEAKVSPKKESKVKKEPKSPSKARDTSPSSSSPKKSPAKVPEVKEGDYNPTLSNYHAIKNACWKEGQPVPYAALCQTLKCCEETSGRLNKTEYLANFYRSVIALNTAEDVVTALHLSLNLLAATYEGVELGIGDMVLIKAISQATGRPNQKIKADMQSLGDLGEVAENSKGSQKLMFKPPPLKMQKVYGQLQKIAKVSGQSSMNTKVDLIKGLLVACVGSEARFLIRSCAGKLRIGVSEATVLSALARAIVFHELGETKNSKFSKERYDRVDAIVKEAYCELPNYKIIVDALLEHGSDNLADHVSLQPGVPLKPMLAHPTKAITEILTRFGAGAEFTAEYKYDGERAQIHLLEDGSFRVYSRNQEDNTSKYPDVMTRMPNCLQDVTSAVIDSESVAWDPETKQILPFQVLTTRKRKDVDAKDIKVQVCIHAFDLLYLNGESLVKKSLRERRELLHKHFKSIEGEFVFATAKDMCEIDELQVFLDQAVKDSTEGLMVKALEDSYEISKRSHSWLKLKKDYLGSGVADSVDVLVMGAYYGKGKRSGNYGGFLLGVYDADNEEYQTVCKLGTGLTDENLKLFTERLEKIKSEKKSYYRLGGVTADVYFEPEMVWEIKCADLSISPVHTAATGLADPSKGISLRFPRFIRERDDKSPEMATSADQIFEMYNSQDVIQNSAARGGPK
ncbi:Oidioi.mRNA.OKI2018_I69.XSR.g13873.t1.cds [Oikopleura dioica]|uniref:DNA ligase n=1 Tax=Oikopleura dioica TaxID=34765 RepID=A0ABN7S886_OIKDI|nr:Oidioi.mRNA.OKI2018_I69.XSR.g13873.t1.cds [Oikopleura dioica]